MKTHVNKLQSIFQSIKISLLLDIVHQILSYLSNVNRGSKNIQLRQKGCASEGNDSQWLINNILMDPNEMLFLG